MWKKVDAYPIVGDSMWVHEEDPHIARILCARETGGDAWAAFNIIQPEIFGAKEKLQFSPTSVHKSEESCLAIKIRQMGLSATDQQYESLLRRYSNHRLQSRNEFFVSKPAFWLLFPRE
jgi:isopropylmalate/homocitrate/citramalate synthase